MLAGKVKLKTFLSLASLLGSALVAGLAWWMIKVTTAVPEVTEAAPAEVPGEAEAPVVDAPVVDAPVESPPSAASDLPAHQADVLTWQGKDLGSDKRKDTTKGRAWKVNVYQDAGQATANRAKVDLDRDDKWDEKWTFEADGRVSRQVAPADDEQYTETWIWNGQDWQREG